MRRLLALILAASVGGADAWGAEKPEFGGIIEASVVFREQHDAPGHDPRVLQVLLRLQNTHDAAVTWTADSVAGIEAELLDKDGKPAAIPPQAASVPSSALACVLPFGSKLDWLISHGGVSIVGESTDQFLLAVGGKAWLIPKESVSEYSLRIHLYGVPWQSTSASSNPKLLIAVPPTRIDLENRPLSFVGPWSMPIVDDAGYAVRGRLVVTEEFHGYSVRDGLQRENRETAVYVELQDASEHVGKSMRLFCDFSNADSPREDHRGLRCELRDREHRPVAAETHAFGGAMPRSEWVTMPPDATIRLRASPFGIFREGGLAITPNLNTLWMIRDDDPNEYFLSGMFTIKPPQDKDASADDHVWRGTIELPPVRVVGRERAIREK